MTTRRTFRAAAARLAILAAIPGLFTAAASGDERADLTLVSDARRFSSDRPRQEVRREFTIPERGVLTLVYTADPWPETAALGGEGIAMKDGSRMESMRSAVRVARAVGRGRSVTTVLLVYAPISKPLEATIAAPGSGDAAHVHNQGTQYASTQRYTIRFDAMGEAVRPGGPAAEVDVSGTWTYDRGWGQSLTFTRRADGLYDVVEKGYGEGRGVAKVEGRILTYEYVNTGTYGSQKSGTYVLEVSGEGGRMAGGWMTDNQEHGDTALTRSTPAPTGPDAGGPEPAGSEPAGPGPGDTEPAPAGTPQEPAATTRFAVQVGVRRAKPGESVFVPVYLLNPGGVANLDAVVTYSPAVAQVPDRVVRGNALGSALFEANPGEAGTVRLGLAGSEGLSESGTLAQIPFEVAGRPGDRTVLRVTVTTAHAADGTRAIPDTIDGLLIVVGPDGHVPGDADGDGVPTAGDALSALKMSVKRIPERLVLDVDGDGAVTSNDARTILRRVVGR